MEASDAPAEAQHQLPVGPERLQAEGQCTDFLPDTDFPGNDLRGVHHVPTKEACCALCANDTRCAGGSWDGPDSPWSDKTCNLKHATSNATRHPAKGMYAFTVRAPVPAPPGGWPRAHRARQSATARVSA